MNNFLKTSKDIYSNVILNPNFYNKVKVIMGNESCDLDSAISSLVYGYFLHKQSTESSDNNIAVLPLLNIPHDDLPLKTEVTYYLKANNICLDYVQTRGCKDLLDLEKIHNAGRLELILVDHHNLSPGDKLLESSVVEVIDHRPRDPNWPWNNVEHVTIRTVGSCCSLIADKALMKWRKYITKEVAKLLLGPIVIDTVNLSPAAGRATGIDHEVVSALEEIVTIDRVKLLDDLVRARSSIDTLSTQQLFRKDLKIIENVPVPGIPTLIESVCKREGFEEDVLTCMRLWNEAPAIVMMGIHVDGDSVQRDLAIISENSVVKDKFSNSLLHCNKPALNLVEIFDHGIPSMRLFHQGNIKATRKHVIPVVRTTAQLIR